MLLETPQADVRECTALGTSMQKHEKSESAVSGHGVPSTSSAVNDADLWHAA